MTKLQNFVESTNFQRFILAVIIINAVTLGLETSTSIYANFGPLLGAIDKIALSIFCVELILKLVVYRSRFFLTGWNNFDLLIVIIALLPAFGPFSVLRALRVIRVFRVFSVLPGLRRIVGGLLNALPGMGAIVMVMTLVFYVGGVLATNLFKEAFPEWFGSLGRSLYTLFQIMTLESWSMGIVRPVMTEYPWAWAFFVPFIICSTFTVLNLFIAVLVNSLQSVHDLEVKLEEQGSSEKREESLQHIKTELVRVRELVSALGEEIKKR